MSHLFPSEGSLLFPQFETYKLHPLESSSDSTSYLLPEKGATLSRVGYSQNHLSFKEVRARIAWDHLNDSVYANRGVYVDVDWNVIGFVIDKSLKPTFSKIAQLPTPISSSEIQSEFPSAIPLDSTHWAISTGSGSLYVLRTTPPLDSVFSGSFVARYDLFSDDKPSSSSIPILIRGAHSHSSSDVRLLLTRSIRSEDYNVKSRSKGSLHAAQSTTFELLEIRLDPTKTNDVDETQGEKLKVQWQLRGGDLPVWTEWHGEKEDGGWIVLSAEEFDAVTEDMDEDMSEEEIERLKREEKISKLGLGASLPPLVAAGTDEPMVQDNEKEEDIDNTTFPYSWSQTSDSIDVSIPLPTGTSKSDIDITFTSTTLSFRLNDISRFTVTSQLAKFLSKQNRSWWTTIDVSASSWTYDSSTHILELDLHKVDENTRWPSVFAPPEDEDEDDEDEDEEEEVPETLSASTLAEIRATFDNIRTRQPDEPEGMHPVLPALLREEMDFDIDDGEDFGEGQGEYNELGGGTGSKVGRDVFVGFVKNGKASWSKTTTTVICTPLNSNDGQGEEDAEEEGIIIKSAVDGLCFSPQSSTNPSRIPWKHICTNPALAFVLSSKRDLRLVKHVGATAALPRTVMAFESGSSLGQGNMYVYYPPTSKTVAKQGVMPVSGGERGALLGVAAIHVGERRVVVALCEKELVVIHGVL